MEAPLILANPILRVGASLYTAHTTSQEIGTLHERITQVYRDVPGGHINSARQALEAAPHSREPTAEIRSAVGHLRDAYNMYNISASRTRKERFLFFTYEVPLFKYKNLADPYETITIIAATLCLMYQYLGSPSTQKAGDFGLLRILTSTF